MIQIKCFVFNRIEENTYIVWDDSLECVIIDCGAFYEEERQTIVNFIKENHLKPVHLLTTHAHLDHNFGINTINDTFGLLPEVSEKDAPALRSLKEQAQNMFGMQLNYDFPPVEHTFNAGEIIKFGHHELTVIECPGHTPGGVTFYCKDEKVAFTGDTLFRGSVGRTDFAGGSMFQLISSLRELSQLPDDTVLYPGHGAQTTMGYELAHNPYMDR